MRIAVRIPADLDSPATPEVAAGLAAAGRIALNTARGLIVCVVHAATATTDGRWYDLVVSPTDEPSAGRPVVCRHCGHLIVADPQLRTPASAWTAPDADDPTACLATAPGHSPLMDRRGVDRPTH